MSRSIIRYTAYLQIVLVLITGCAPTQPFFIAKDNSMAHYLDQALAIEYADVQVESLPEASGSMQPLGPANTETEYVELSLEDCISMALQNTKILRVANGSNQQSGSVAALLLSAQPGQLPSAYDSALVSSIASTQPLQIDGQGNRVPFRGAIRSNQVGGVEDALSEFDAQFSSIFGYNTTDRPRNVGPNNPFNPQFFRAIDANYQSAISKRLATGGVATLRAGTIYSDNNIQIGTFQGGRQVPSDYTQTLEMQLTHPLLRGRGTLVNRIPVVLARINEDISLHEFEANVRNLVKATEDAYWDLYCGYRLVESAQQSLDTAIALWRVAAETARAGSGRPEAEAQARGLYGTFYNQLISAKHGSTVPGNDPRGLYGREQILREKIGWPTTDKRLIRPSDVPTDARVDFEWHSILSEALCRNVDLRRQKWFIKGVELEIQSAKNQLLAQLDVTGIYRWVGFGDELASTDRSGIRPPNAGSTALESLTSGDFQELGARLEFTPTPFGSRRALAGIQNRKLALAKSHAELQEKEMALVGELSFAWRNLDSTHEQIRILRDQWAANMDEIKVYRDRIERGLVSEGNFAQQLDALLRAEERRATAQRNYYQALCEYNKSIINIHYLKGSLLDLNSIALQEGPWPAKAYWDAEELSKQRAAGTYFDYGYTRPAVVSRGQVQAGMPTEGNRPTGGEGVIRSNKGEPTPADDPDGEFPELKGRDKDEDAPKSLKGESAPRAAMPTPRNSMPVGTSPRSPSQAQAKPARSAAGQAASVSFDDHNEVAPVVKATANAQANSNRSVAVQAGGTSTKSDMNNTQWRAKTTTKTR